MNSVRRVLATGGLGYVGGRLCKQLLQRGCEVRIATRRDRATQPRWSAAADVRRANLLDPADVADLCRDVDTIVHLSGLNEVDAGTDHAGAVRHNVESTAHLLQAARKAGVSRFVYVSTARIYGEPLVGVITEDVPPRPVHPYGITHRAAEDFVLAAHAKQEISGLVLRVSNVIGAPADTLVNRWTLVANDLCRQAIVDGKVTLRSSGLQQRDFITLGDVVGATEHLLRMTPQSWGDGVFNVGTSRSMSVWDLAQMIARRAERMTGRPMTATRVEPSADERHPALDFRIDRLKATGFAPTYDFEAEIDGTLELCRDFAGALS